MSFDRGGLGPDRLAEKLPRLVVFPLGKVGLIVVFDYVAVVRVVIVVAVFVAVLFQQQGPAANDASSSIFGLIVLQRCERCEEEI